MISLIRIFRGAAVLGFAELRAFYTWRTWFGGWLVRLISQVIFFALLGRLVRSASETQFIAVGNSVALVSIEASLVILSMCGERMTGTLPLIIAAPGSHLPVYLGRGVQWLCTGLVSSSAAFLIVPWLLGVTPSYPRSLLALPVLVVIGLSTYCYGCFLGCLAIRFLRWQWLVLNFGYLILLTLSGVNVPIGFWPAPIHDLALALPLTHGLEAIRALIAHQYGQVGPQLAEEVLVGCAWLLLAIVSGQRLVTHGRADGSIEFA